MDPFTVEVSSKAPGFLSGKHLRHTHTHLLRVISTRFIYVRFMSDLCHDLNIPNLKAQLAGEHGLGPEESHQQSSGARGGHGFFWPVFGWASKGGGSMGMGIRYSSKFRMDQTGG